MSWLVYPALALAIGVVCLAFPAQIRDRFMPRLQARTPGADLSVAKVRLLGVALLALAALTAIGNATLDRLFGF